MKSAFLVLFGRWEYTKTGIYEQAECPEDDLDEDWSKSFDETFHHQIPQNKVCTSVTECKDVGKNEHVNHDKTKESNVYHPRTVVHIDVDCFYAQVEMIRNPALRTRPLGIQQKYIIVTCNYEARKHGVTKLMLVSDALKKCPELVLVKGEDLTHYREMSYKITEHLSKYIGSVERLGFDENYVDVSDMVAMPPWNTNTSKPTGHIYACPSEEDFQQKLAACPCGCGERLAIGSQIAAEMRRSLFEELSITCCAGIGHNKLLAKMVGSVHKPNQQTTIFPAHVFQFMRSLKKVREIPGIGRKCSQRLECLGVYSVEDLQQCDVKTLAEEFGDETGTMLQQLSFGEDKSQVVTTGQPQSLSDEDSFKKCDNYNDVKSKIEELLNSLLRRLLLDGRIAQTLRVTVRKYVTGERYHGHRQARQGPIPSLVFRQFNAGNLDSVREKLMPLATKLFHKSVDTSQPFHLTLINVCFSNLTEAGQERNSIMSFFKPRNESQAKETKQPTVEPYRSDGTCSDGSLHDLVGHEPQTIPCARKSTGGLDKMRETAMPAPVTPLHLETNNNLSRCDAGKQSGGDVSMSPAAAEDAHADIENSKKQTAAIGNNAQACDRDLNAADVDQNDADALVEYLRKLLPSDIDPSTFLELPHSIQKDLLRQANLSFSKMASILVKVDALSGFKEEAEDTLSNDTSTGSSLRTCDVALDKPSSSACLSVDTSTKSVQITKSRVSHSSTGPSKVLQKTQTVSTSEHFNSENSIPDTSDSSPASGDCSLSQTDKQNPVKEDVPPGVDKSVFFELPPEMRKSLVLEWKTKAEFQNMKKRKLSSPENKQNLKRKSGSILTFFQKK